MKDNKKRFKSLIYSVITKDDYSEFENLDKNKDNLFTLISELIEKRKDPFLSEEVINKIDDFFEKVVTTYGDIYKRNHSVYTTYESTIEIFNLICDDIDEEFIEKHYKFLSKDLGETELLCSHLDLSEEFKVKHKFRYDIIDNDKLVVRHKDELGGKYIVKVKLSFINAETSDITIKKIKIVTGEKYFKDIEAYCLENNNFDKGALVQIDIILNPSNDLNI